MIGEALFTETGIEQIKTWRGCVSANEFARTSSFECTSPNLSQRTEYPTHACMSGVYVHRS